MTDEELMEQSIAEETEHICREATEAVAMDFSDMEMRLARMFCAEDLPKVLALIRNMERPVTETDDSVEPEAAEKPKRKRRQKESQENWIPLRKLFKIAQVPEMVADVIQAAIDKMMAKGDIGEDNKWQMLEYLCAEYLAEE